ncbi:MAG: tetratricopeptide repeat protein [Gammaproteobacteria bacterium]|nr:tetratricopeptide repeat protein [Gammaproteobacteria bacterium]
MKTSNLLISLLLFLGAGLSATLPVYAQSGQVNRQTFSMSEMVYKALNAVQVLIDEKNFDQALADLADLRERRITDYERAHTWNMEAYVHFETNDYDAAMLAYENLMQSERIPDGLRQGALKGLSQLSLLKERYDDVINYAQQLLDFQKVQDIELYILMGQAYYRQEKYREALVPVLDAIDLQQQAGNSIKENWYLLLNAIYYSLEDYPGMQSTLKALIVDHPKPAYLLNLAAVYSEQGEITSQMALMESLYESDQLDKESQLVNLANLFMFNKVPYKAAVLLEKAMSSGVVKPIYRNYQYLAQAWQLAGNVDRAFEPLTRAAELADDGTAYLRLAQLYFGKSSWKESEAALIQALEKGGLNNTGNAYLLLGMARFNQKAFATARVAFENAEKDEKMSRLAGQWLSYLQTEEEKYASLEAD